MRWLPFLGAAVGLGAVAWMLAAVDLDALVAALAAAGWGVLLGVSAAKLLSLGFDALAWRAVIPGPRRPGFGRVFAARWIGEAVNTLLPVAQVGGDLARGRLIALAGVPGPAAAASVAVDFTLGVATQAVVTVMAVGLLLWHGLPQGLGLPVAGGLAALALGAALLLAAQRDGALAALSGLAGKVGAGRSWRDLSGGLGAFREALRALYADRPAVRSCAAWRGVGWLAHAAETWAALWLLGAAVGWGEALVIEMVGNAARSAAFLIPGAVGAQEGGLLAIGLVYGLSPETALGLALIKRARELAVSLPALAVWGWLERKEDGE